MESDIVARLRAVLHNDRSVELMNREAADEIERLRKERDEARQMYCELMSKISRQQDCPPQWFAEEQGWDCFKENTDYLQDLG